MEVLIEQRGASRLQHEFHAAENPPALLLRVGDALGCQAATLVGIGQTRRLWHGRQDKPRSGVRNYLPTVEPCFGTASFECTQMLPGLTFQSSMVWAFHLSIACKLRWSSTSTLSPRTWHIVAYFCHALNQRILPFFHGCNL